MDNLHDNVKYFDKDSVLFHASLTKECQIIEISFVTYQEKN